MPAEWNTLSIVEVPRLFVRGLLHVSERPTWLGSAAFKRSTLSNVNRLSSGERPGPKFPWNGMTWACAAVMSRQAASGTDKQRDDQGSMHLSEWTRLPRISR